MSEQVHLAYRIHCGENLENEVIALLEASGFEAFEEKSDSVIIAYFNVENEKQVGDALQALTEGHLKHYERLEIPYQNWNAIWESNFKAIRIADFCMIRASFQAPADSVKYDLVIDPKLAFGTGHHETTRLMIQQMQEMELENKEVFDFGCGTGVLSLLAKKMGAAHVDAIDISVESYENTMENLTTNAIEGVDAFHSDLKGFTKDRRSYDLILANINKAVLMNDMVSLSQLLKKDGTILVSGILERDRADIHHKLKGSGFRLGRQMQEGEWLCIEAILSADAF